MFGMPGTSWGCLYGCSRVVPLGIVHYPIRILVSYPFLKWSYVKVFELIRVVLFALVLYWVCVWVLILDRAERSSGIVLIS